jgi:hypothetical protein
VSLLYLLLTQTLTLPGHIFPPDRCTSFYIKKFVNRKEVKEMFDLLKEAFKLNLSRYKIKSEIKRSKRKLEKTSDPLERQLIESDIESLKWHNLNRPMATKRR